MNDHKIIVFWSDADQAFVANVPELPGCMAHGDAHELALWIEAAQANGRAVPQARGAWRAASLCLITCGIA